MDARLLRGHSQAGPVGRPLDVVRVRDRLDTAGMARRLMPKSFTLPELQHACEAVWGTPVDKRNFRKKLSALDLVETTGELRHGGAHRPAKLYRVKDEEK